MLTQAVDQRRGTFHVGHQHRDKAGRKLHSWPQPTKLTLRLQLTGDEPDRHDPVPLGCVQQSLAGARAGVFVFELDLAESSEGVPDVSLVMDRQPPPAPGVHVGERPVGEVRPLASAEPGHATKILAATDAVRLEELTPLNASIKGRSGQ